MKSLVNKVILIALMCMVLMIGAIAWFITSSYEPEKPVEVDPLESIIHDEMFHQDSRDAQDPDSILRQFKRKTPLPKQD